MKGKISSYLKERKYGFIKSDSGDDYFFHFNNVSKDFKSNDIQQGMIVDFDPKSTPRGLAAKNIKI